MLWIATAAVAADCTVTDRELDGIASQASSAVENDDVTGFRRTERAFQDKLTCLDRPVPAESLARMAVLAAIVDFADGKPVEPAVWRARQIDPSVDLPGFLPSPRGPDGSPQPLPDRLVLYVDGKRVEALPPFDGERVLQRVTDGRWETLIASTVPRSWMRLLPSGPVATGPPELRFLASAGPGWTRIAQRSRPEGDFLPEATKGALGLVLEGEARAVIGPAGGYGRITAPLWLGSLGDRGPRPDPAIELGGMMVVESVELELGLHLGGTPLLEGGRGRWVIDPLPMLGVRGFQDGLDFGATLGLWPDQLRIQGRGGLTLDDGPVRIGIRAGLQSRRFTQALPYEPTTRLSTFDVATTLGVSL